LRKPRWWSSWYSGYWTSEPGILAPTCFNCGRSGHYSRVCPAPRANRRQSGTGSFFSRPQRRSRTSNFLLLVKPITICDRLVSKSVHFVAREPIGSRVFRR
uniref:CCHC-type domain-containing protein n=1 Tax=Haemonchus placei TaxID=6290 RepID=A0A0N4X063_HAEPC